MRLCIHVVSMVLFRVFPNFGIHRFTRILEGLLTNSAILPHSTYNWYSYRIQPNISLGIVAQTLTMYHINVSKNIFNANVFSNCNCAIYSMCAMMHPTTDYPSDILKPSNIPIICIIIYFDFGSNINTLMIE